MSVLVDTNILLRSIEPPHPQHAIAVGAVYQLLAEGTPVYFTLQNIAEFWNVATRPSESNGLGLSITSTLGEVEKIEGLLTLLRDTPAVYAEWKRIIVELGVSGVKVHDARLVATMKTHGVRSLLTFDVDDFTRYTGIEVIHPKAVVA
ncbi:MAG: PIN domain-containing protein [Bryobacteraceae bacterium]|jgi:predicted nucleic acid-binding protein